MITVAAAQAEAQPGDLGANVATAARLTRLAGEQGAALVVLPEAFLTGYDAAVFAQGLPTVDVVTGGVLDPLREAARETEATVVVSTALEREHGDVISSLVVRPDGTALVPYDKQHLDGIEKDHFTPGDHGASVTVGGFELGLSICYDGSFPEHARAAAADGAIGYVCSMAYFPGGEHRRDLHYAARALENGFYVVVSGLTGRCGGSRFIGGSAVYDPEGRPLARLGEEEGVAVAVLDPDLVRRTRARHTMHDDHRADLGPRVRVQEPA